MSEILIEFNCADQGVVKDYPPLPANKLIPGWYKDLDTECPVATDYVNEEGIPTIKRCMPVQDYITGGYVIRNVYQSHIRQIIEKTAENYVGYEIKSKMDQGITGHPYHQCPVKINDKKNHFFKIHNPWQIKTPPGYSCHIYQPYYFFRQDFSIFPAIVDTDTHDDFIQFVAVANTENVILNPGDPLVVVFPFKREDWTHQCNYDSEILDKTSFKYTLKKKWNATYQKFMHSKKKFK